ncbi:MAG: ribosome hibernation-promoting factor, HPF/YfiA family [Vampirovibrionales bacterium]
MARLTVTARHMVLTDAVKAYAEDKFSHLAEMYNFVKSLQVVVHVAKNPSVSDGHHATLSLHVKGAKILRFSAKAETLYAALDLLLEKTDRNLDKYKEKNLARTLQGHRSRGVSLKHQPPVSLVPDDHDPYDGEEYDYDPYYESEVA